MKLPSNLHLCRIIGLLQAGPIFLLDGAFVLINVMNLAKRKFEEFLKPDLWLALLALAFLTSLAVILYRLYDSPRSITRIRIIVLYIVLRAAVMFLALWFVHFTLPNLKPMQLALTSIPIAMDVFCIYTLGFSAVARQYFDKKDPQHVA